MTVEELLIEGKKKIHSDQAKLLLATYLNWNPLELYLHLDDVVDQEICQKYQESIEAIANQKPLQYVIGTVNFYGLEFQIDESVLIPRCETEELVEKTLNYMKEYFPQPVDVIDLGTGSGVIGLTIKKHRPDCNVTLLDISEDALEVAKKNSAKLGLYALLEQKDMLEENTGKYDVIISNPPYIAFDEEIEPIVKENEPSLALYGGEDGLDFYRKILKEVPTHTKESYLLAFEIGAGQKEELLSLVRELLPNDQAIVEKDLQGRNRFLFVFHNLV